MTTKEYLQAKLQKFGISQEQINLIIVENNLSDLLNVALVKEAIYNSFSE